MSETNTQRIEKLANELADVTSRLKLLESSQHVLTTTPAGMPIEPYKSHAFAHLEDLIPLIKAINSGGGASYNLEQRVDLLESGQNILTSAVRTNELAITGLESGQNILTSAVNTIHSDNKWVDVTSQITFNQDLLNLFNNRSKGLYNLTKGYYNSFLKTLRVEVVGYWQAYVQLHRTPSSSTTVIANADLDREICNFSPSLFGHSTAATDKVFISVERAQINNGDYTQIFGTDETGTTDKTGFEGNLASSMIGVSGISGTSYRVSFDTFWNYEFLRKNNIYFLDLVFTVTAKE